MKYLILLPLLLLSCAKKCPDIPWKDIKYGDTVEITQGFYKDAKGWVQGQRTAYETYENGGFGADKTCAVPAYAVSILGYEEVITLKQSILKKIK